MESDIDRRISITKFFQCNDRNGCYTDENCDIEFAVKYLFGVISDDFN